MVNEAPISVRISRPCTAFEGHRLLSSGALAKVALLVKAANAHDPASSILVFDDATGRVIDLDVRGTDADVIKRLSKPDRACAGRYRAPSPPEPERVARGLVTGKTLEEIATEQSVSRNTVRTHLRGVMEKTGCNRQAEVVALLGGLTPLNPPKGE